MPHGHGHDDEHGHGGHGGHNHGHDLEAPLLPAAAKDGAGGHGHSHECHGHSHGVETPRTEEDIRKLRRAVCLALLIMLVEIVGGVVSGSLAVIVDAAHMLSDVGGFIISLISLHLAKKAASEDFTYGFKQAEVVGAFLSILIVWAMTAILLFEALLRFLDPPEIQGAEMFGIAVIGFIVNLILFSVLGHSHGHDDHGHSHGGEAGNSIAIKAAIIHVIGDIVQSLGVCLAAVLIWLKPFEDLVGTVTNSRGEAVSRWTYADPCCTVLFGFMVLWTTKSTITFAMDSLMVRAPKHISQAELVMKLTGLPNVKDVHDLHVWSLGSTEVLCTAHIMVEGQGNTTRALEGAIKVAQGMGIGHTTFQIEIVGEFDPSMESYGGFNCSTPKVVLPSGDGHAHDSHDDGCCGGHGGHDGHDGGHGHAHGNDTGHSSGHGGHSSGHGSHSEHGHSH